MGHDDVVFLEPLLSLRLRDEMICPVPLQKEIAGKNP